MVRAKEKGWPIGAVRKLEDMGNARMPSPGKLILCQFFGGIHSKAEREGAFLLEVKPFEGVCKDSPLLPTKGQTVPQFLGK
jgi:hypothetical protein